MVTCLLVDNGSLRASSTLNLRRIAAQLGEATGRSVAPVSLLHSSKVDPAELGGIPAEVLQPALRRRLEDGEERFLLIPLFFGPSLAWTDYLPKRIAFLQKEFPALRVGVAPTIFDVEGGGDLRLATILQERVEEKIPAGERPAVVLVDHGSPVPEVTYVRNFVAGQLASLLEGKISRLAAASMERRPGELYRFNDPLLEAILTRDGFNQGRVVLAPLFLSPGRHAGEGGDLDVICREAEGAHPGLQVIKAGLVGDHPRLIEILADRMRQGLAKVGD